MSSEHVVSGTIALPVKRMISLGKLRGRPSDNGGYFIDIVGGGETRRAELTPREAMIVATGLLRFLGIEIAIDPAQFKHFNG